MINQTDASKCDERRVKNKLNPLTHKRKGETRTMGIQGIRLPETLASRGEKAQCFVCGGGIYPRERKHRRRYCGYGKRCWSCLPLRFLF